SPKRGGDKKSNERHADIDHMHLTKKRLRGGVREARFRRYERARVMSPDGGGGGRTGVGVEAAGEIDRETAATLAVDPIDQRVVRWPRCSGRSGAEQGVDDPRRVVR